MYVYYSHHVCVFKLHILKNKARHVVSTKIMLNDVQLSFAYGGCERKNGYLQ